MGFFIGLFSFSLKILKIFICKLHTGRNNEQNGKCVTEAYTKLFCLHWPLESVVMLQVGGLDG